MLYITEKDFETQVRNYAINMDFDEELILKFLNKWCAVNEGGWKMAWQKEKTFDIKRRMGTFVINKKKWNKKPRLTPQKYVSQVRELSEKEQQELKDIQEGYKRLGKK